MKWEEGEKRIPGEVLSKLAGSERVIASLSPKERFTCFAGILVAVDECSVSLWCVLCNTL